MKKRITACSLPLGSIIETKQHNAYFSDSYRFSSPFPERTALEVWLAHMATIPNWVKRLMTLRNQIVSKLGLKNLGQIDDLESGKAAKAYQAGDKVGIFTLLSVSDGEIILCDSDKHLDVQISVHKEKQQNDVVTISTVVHVHNLLGRIYMLFVTPAHKMIVPATIRRAEFQ
jgi:hypothetical protein